MDYALDTNAIVHYLSKEPNTLLNFNNAAISGCNLVIPKAVDNGHVNCYFLRG